MRIEATAGANRAQMFSRRTRSPEPPKGDFSPKINIFELKSYTTILKLIYKKNWRFFSKTVLQFCGFRSVLYESFGIRPIVRRDFEKMGCKIFNTN